VVHCHTGISRSSASPLPRRSPRLPRDPHLLPAHARHPQDHLPDSPPASLPPQACAANASPRDPPTHRGLAPRPTRPAARAREPIALLPFSPRRDPRRAAPRPAWRRSRGPRPAPHSPVTAASQAALNSLFAKAGSPLLPFGTIRETSSCPRSTRSPEEPPRTATSPRPPAFRAHLRREPRWPRPRVCSRAWLRCGPSPRQEGRERFG